MLQQLFSIIKANWPFLVLAVILFAVCFFFLRFLAAIRDNARRELAQLFETNLPAYIERLENNRMLALVYRRSNILMMLLDGYLAAGDDEKARATIAALDKMNIEPQERVEFYQKRLSFFVSVPDGEEARRSLASLEAYLTKLKALETPRYAEILEEAQLLVRIYIDHDVRLIGRLQQLAAKTKNPVMRGITQYRIAKLAYFAGDGDVCTKYLVRAQGNVKGTYYAPIVEAALADRTILERK